MSSRTATTVYDQQNRSIHKALAMLKMPYKDYREELLDTFTQVLGRKRTITGISGLSLGDRHRIIKHFKTKGMRIMNPPVGKHLWRWKKGQQDQKDEGRGDVKFEPDRPMKIPAEKRPLVGKVHAILADLKLPWSYADGIAKQMHGIQFVEWCSKKQLNDVVIAMVTEQRKQYADGKKRFKAL